MTEVYRRRISSEEAKTGRFMVLKSALSFFPETGTTFRLSDGSDTRTVCVEAVPCVCRGPQRPHEHYFVPWPGLEKGARIEITPVGERAYALKAE